MTFVSAKHFLKHWAPSDNLLGPKYMKDLIQLNRTGHISCSQEPNTDLCTEIDEFSPQYYFLPMYFFGGGFLSTVCMHFHLISYMTCLHIFQLSWYWTNANIWNTWNTSLWMVTFVFSLIHYFLGLCPTGII